MDNGCRDRAPLKQPDRGPHLALARRGAWPGLVDGCRSAQRTLLAVGIWSQLRELLPPLLPLLLPPKVKELLPSRALLLELLMASSCRAERAAVSGSTRVGSAALREDSARAFAHSSSSRHRAQAPRLMLMVIMVIICRPDRNGDFPRRRLAN